MVMTHDEEVSEDTAGVYTAQGTRLDLDTTPQDKIKLLEEKVRTLQEEVRGLKQSATVVQPTKTKHTLVDVTNDSKMNKLREVLVGGRHVLNIDGLKFKLDGNINIEGEVTW